MVLRLSLPEPRLRVSYLGALEELAAEGNSHYLDLVLQAEPGFPGVTYTLQTLADPGTFVEFCAYTTALAEPGTPRPAGWVTGTYLWMVDDDNLASRKVIEANGGRLEDVRGHKLRFWVPAH